MTATPEQDYYQLLGVERTASTEEIKSAYRSLAQRYHPDVNPRTRATAAAKFKQITAAYSVLSDPSRRNEYDSAFNIAEETGPDTPAPRSPAYGSGRAPIVAFDVYVGGTSRTLHGAELRSGLIRVLKELAHLIEQSFPE